MGKFMDLTGERFGKLVALAKTNVSTYGDWIWACRCDCGNHAEIRGTSLRQGKTRSCGCLHHDTITRHGRSKTTEFTIWQMMRQRCNNPKHCSFREYGGRGINVCERWEQSFALFLSDMGERPSPKHTLERKDNNKGYSPDNCCWATCAEQGSNKRNNRRLVHDGKSLTLSAWARQVGISKSTILKRIKAGYTVAQSLTKPPNRGVSVIKKPDRSCSQSRE